MNEDDVFSDWLLFTACSLPTTVMILIGFGLCVKHGSRLPRSSRLVCVGLLIGAVFSSGVWFLVSRFLFDEGQHPEMTRDYFVSTFIQRLPSELLGATLTAVVAYAALVPEPTPLGAEEGGGDVE